MVAEKGASGEFDVFDEPTDYASETDLDYLLGEDASRAHDSFDAFDENTWDQDFTPVSTTPWYRSRQALTLMIASATALSAIVVSVVLLVFRDTSSGDDPVPAPRTTAVTTPLATATSEKPPPPPPPPPPPAPEPSTMERAPAVVRPPVPPRPTKKPEIGVTRTPATRSPMSVAPQQRGPGS